MLGATSGVRILGTDVSAEAVRAAGRATYTGRTLEPVPAMVRDRWMERRPGGARGGAGIEGRVPKQVAGPGKE